MSCSGRVVQWAGGNVRGSDCEQPGPVLSASGKIPTLVVARTSAPCQSEDGAREYKGIVFYDFEPQAWLCLSADEIPEFKAWAMTKFTSVQIVTVVDAEADILCPPQPHGATAPDPHSVEEARATFAECAPQWFVPAQMVA